MKKIEREVPEKKKKLVTDLVNLMKKSNTVMLLSIEGIPSDQFQRTKKDLKDIAQLKVVKKKIITLAFKEADSSKKGIESLTKKAEGNFAILFSEKDAFEIAAILNQHKKPAKARAGQIAPEDIIIEAGPTDIPAGPALSELSKLGLKATIESGKIAIRERKVVAKKGEKISKDAATALTSLEISPFYISLKPTTAYDSKSGKVYNEINVDPEMILKELQEAASKSLGFAVSINYLCKETIKQLIITASNEAGMLSQNLKN